MTAWHVLKFGGTSVSSRERWDTIASVVGAKIEAGVRPVVVCSALSGVSNLLEELLQRAIDGEHEPILDEIRHKHVSLAGELDLEAGAVVGDELEALERLALGASLTNEVSPRLWARVLAMGELMSTKLGAAYLASVGITAAWQDAREALVAIPSRGDNENRHYLSATCDFEPDASLAARWEQLDAQMVLTQGFIARDREGATVLLGRGGSDTSAAYLAAKLKATVLEIWTDVPGMYTANPRGVPSARLLKHLAYDEAQEIATMGAKVLHPRCIDPVRRQNIPLRICCTQAPEVEGTLISSTAPDLGAQVKAISAKNGVVLISMDTVGMWQQVGFLGDIFACFKDNGLSVDLVATSETNVTVSLDPGANALDETTTAALLADLSRYCRARRIGPCAAVSLVGHKIRAIMHKLGPALEVFEEQSIYLVSQAASDLNLTFVVDEAQAERLVNKLHNMLFDDRVSDDLLGPTWREVFEGGESAPLAPADAWWTARASDLVAAVGGLDCAYVYDQATLRSRAETMRDDAGVDRVFYAIKANPNPEILRLFEGLGLGFECVSPGELDRVVETLGGLDPSRILFTPNFAAPSEYARAFELGAHVTLDNLHPLENAPSVFAGREVIVRIDPGQGRGHHKFVRTAGPTSKFGVAPSELHRLRELCAQHGVTVVGLHSHVGSGIREPQTWSETASFLAELADDLGTVRVLNLGGGLGVPEKPSHLPLDVAAVGGLVARFRQAHPEYELWMEPGRFLVSEAGVLVARVTQTKRKGELHYVGLATGMNSLIRPALYGAYHRIVNLTRIDERAAIVADVVGPICETGDVLGHRRRLPITVAGDLLLIGTAGAYGRAMASHYNLREPAPELFV